MNIDQLKLILETVNAAGEGGKEVFFWWLARGFFSDIGGFLLVGFLLYIVYYGMKQAIFHLVFTQQLMDAMDTRYGLSQKVKNSILKVVEKHRNEI